MKSKEFKKGKVKTNDYKVNVLVEHEDGQGRHYSNLDIPVICSKLSDEEINDAFDKLEFTLEQKKDFLKKIKGYAISNCTSINKDFTTSDLFEYKQSVVVYIEMHEDGADATELFSFVETEIELPFQKKFDAYIYDFTDNGGISVAVDFINGIKKKVITLGGWIGVRR